MTGWMVLGTVLLFLAASAVGCYPGKQRISKHLTVAAGISMALTVVTSMMYKENMFSDALILPSALWLRAIFAIAVCIGLGILLARLVKGRGK